MMPKLANEVFSVKSTQIVHLERHITLNLITLQIGLANEVYIAASITQTDRATAVTLVHAPRINYTQTNVG